jgi:hypothetical protein
MAHAGAVDHRGTTPEVASDPAGHQEQPKLSLDFMRMIALRGPCDGVSRWGKEIANGCRRQSICLVSRPRVYSECNCGGRMAQARLSRLHVHPPQRRVRSHS